MLQPAQDIYRFDLAQAQFQRIRMMGWLFLSVLMIGAVATLLIGIWLWTTYQHTFTLYLKWQDALVSLSWFLTFLSLGACVLVYRFIHAVHAGRTQGMVILEGSERITVRDLSPENLKSIGWIMNSAFWCFVATLIGLVPAILIGWTLSIENTWLSTIATGVAIILSLAGLVVSLIAASFIIVGCIGMVSFCRKQGSSTTYQLNGQATVRIDNFILTISYPSMTESMVDLNLLEIEDQQLLLSLLHTRWMDSKRLWSPTLGEEIAQALETAEKSKALVSL